MGGDGRRTFLVVSDEVELFAALRPELDGAMLQLWWTTHDACSATADRFLPWPWAICGVDGGPREEALAHVLIQPVLWFWLGQPPRWLPSHHRCHSRWRELLADVRACLDRSVGGVSLAPNRGLLGPEGRLVLSPALEALVSVSPAPVTMTARSQRAVRGVVLRHRLPLVLSRASDGARVVEAA